MAFNLPCPAITNTDKFLLRVVKVYLKEVKKPFLKIIPDKPKGKE